MFSSWYSWNIAEMVLNNGKSTLYILEIRTRCHKAVEYELHTCTYVYSKIFQSKHCFLDMMFWLATFSSTSTILLLEKFSEWVVVVKHHLSNVSAISWREHVNFKWSTHMYMYEAHTQQLYDSESWSQEYTMYFYLEKFLKIT
jgi:hypothetical protein